jgi:hypothetical protein
LIGIVIAYDCKFWQEAEPGSGRRGRFLFGSLYVSSTHLFFASNHLLELSIKFQVPLMLICAVEMDCVQRDSLLFATETGEKTVCAAAHV